MIRHPRSSIASGSVFNFFEKSAISYSKANALSEDDIIVLQDQFLTYGFHDIAVSNQDYGREIIMTLLSSLPHKNIACLTIAPLNLPNFVTDLAQEIIEYQNTCSFDRSECCMHEFLYLYLHYDFFWLEITDKLVNQSWFDLFEQALINTKLYTHIPIVRLSYINS